MTGSVFLRWATSDAALPVDLQHLDADLLLIFSDGAVDAAGRRRQLGVARHEDDVDALVLLAELDAEAVGVDADLDHVAQRLERLGGEGVADLGVALGRDDASMQGRSARHHLTDGQRVVRLAGTQFAQHLSRHWHVRRSADQQHLVDLIPAQSRVA